MKILVNEIEKDVLFKMAKIFLNNDEITFLNYADKSFSTLYCNNPFYIEENIKDIKRILYLCNHFNYRNTDVSWNDLDDFMLLLYSIYTQKDIGRKVDDIEYLYLKLKDKYDLTFTNTVSLNIGFTINVPCIIGKSKLGEMCIYKDDGYTFVFDVKYVKKNIFGKMKTKFTHWHPQNLFQALEDIDEFMNNNTDLFGL